MRLKKKSLPKSMSEFYHQLITEKSLKTLQELKRRFKFILIGGWAVFLYTKVLKSKDIDIILDYDELSKMKEEFEVFKNERLKKYEAKQEEIDIDIYLPHFSELGLPAEDIKDHCQSQEGFLVPLPEILLILKTHAFLQRQGTTKGKKDIIDIFSLISQKKISWPDYKELITKYNLKELSKELGKLISSVRAIPELGFSNHQIARLKKETLAKL